MKKIVLSALVAAMVIGLGSCVKISGEDGPAGGGNGGNGGGEIPAGTAVVNIKLSEGARGATRSVEAPATDGDGDLVIEDNRGIIFVADGDGAIIQAEDLDATDATDADGQTLPVPVPINSSVFVVANVPSGEVSTIKALTKLDDVKAYSSNISTQDGVGSSPAMANVRGTGVTVSNTGIVDGKKTIEVDINPLVARLEVVAMQAVADAVGNTITSYTVTGVYVNGFYTAFNYEGGAATDGTLTSRSTEIKAATDEGAVATILSGWENYMSDTGSWASGGNATTKDPGDTGNVWAFNLVPEGKPDIIFVIEDIEGEDSTGADFTIDGPRFITVEGYTGDSAVTEFARGNVYRIGAITGTESNFKFSLSHLNTNPYEESVGLNVIVDVIPWEITDYTPVLRP